MDQAFFHGTPAKFESFSTDFIGTGEGAQAFGYGLYFAENPDVARSYQRALAAREIEGKPADWDNPAHVAAAWVHNTGSTEAAIEYLENVPSNQDPAVSGAIDLLKRGADLPDVSAGNFYEVEIPDDVVGRMLNWDVPFDEQPESVKTALATFAAGDDPQLQELFADGITPEFLGVFPKSKGGQIYRTLAESIGDQELSKRLAEAGIPGIQYLDRQSRFDGEGTRNIVLFDASSIESVTRNGQVLSQDVRGQIALPETPGQESVISLLRDADLSTFLHESGHFFLEVTADLATQPNADQQVVDDMNALLSWFGFEGDVSQWRNRSIDERREAHEQFARGFEAYLLEGKAPNQELRGLFQRFRAWLVMVYRTVRNLNVELTDDVRAVMDRMLASADEIRTAQQLREMNPLFASERPEGMTDSEWLDYQALGADATNRAQDELQRRSLRDLRWLRNARSRKIKELQKETRARYKAVRAEVAQDVAREPIRVAASLLRTGKAFAADGTEIDLTDQPHKLSVDALEAAYGSSEEVEGVLRDSGFDEGGRPLWKEIPTVYKTKGEGLDADMVARVTGLPSGDALVRQLADLTPLNEEIDARTDVEMIRRYGDINSPRAVEEAADLAVHNELRMKMVASEYKALENSVRARRGQSPTSQSSAAMKRAAKQYAEGVVADRKIRDLKPGAFGAAETRAARQARDAHTKGDLQAAATHKRNQLLNGYAAKSAREAQQEIEKRLRYFRKFQREGTRKNLDPDYLDQIDKLLERYDLRQRTLRQIDNRAALADWIKSQEDNGFDPAIDPALRDEAKRTHYKNMTVNQFRGWLTQCAVSSIWRV